MAVKEDFSARRLTGTTYERTYTVDGTDDEATARAALLASAECPAVLGGTFRRQDAQCGVEQIAANHWRGTGVWKTPEGGGQRDVDSFTVSFDISGQSVRVNQALTHLGDYAPAGQTPQNFKGAINVTEDSVEGTEILIPFATFCINYTFANASITDAYFRTLGDIVGCQNDATFRGFAAGELLLTRVSGQKSSMGNFDISFAFAISRNATDLVVTSHDGDITIPAKCGWDYLWTRYDRRTKTDGSGYKSTSLVPVSAHLEQVYWTNDFALLGMA